MGLILRSLLLAYRGSPSGHVLTRPPLFVSVEKRSKLPMSILLRAPSHHEGPILLISSKPNYLPKTSSPNTFILRTRDSTYGFGGYMDIKSIIGPEKVLVAQSCQTLCHPIV